MNYQQVKNDMQTVVLDHLKTQGIDPLDSTRVIMNAPEVWKALCTSGKMPKFLTYQMMMQGMTSAALSASFGKWSGI